MTILLWPGVDYFTMEVNPHLAKLTLNFNLIYKKSKKHFDAISYILLLLIFIYICKLFISGEWDDFFNIHKELFHMQVSYDGYVWLFLLTSPRCVNPSLFESMVGGTKALLYKFSVESISYIYRSMVYICWIMFIFDKLHHSLAGVTPGEYECDMQ